MLKHYETVFIMTPVLSEDQMKETVKKFENILVEKGAEIVHQENWGLKRLEYHIQKKSTGFYHLFEFKAEPQVVGELELQYRRDERVIRFLTITLDKDAIAYAEKRRTLGFGQKKEIKPEPVYEIKHEPKHEVKYEVIEEVIDEVIDDVIEAPIEEQINEPNLENKEE
jgi:small subunit ribosomal protein S6